MQGKVLLFVSQGIISRIVATRHLEVRLIDWDTAEPDKAWFGADHIAVEVVQLPQFERQLDEAEREFQRKITEADRDD